MSEQHTTEIDAPVSETGVSLTVDEAARYYTWALDDPDPYRRGFARGLATAARVIPPGDCANPECDHDRTIPSPGCALRHVIPPGSTPDVSSVAGKTGDDDE